MSETVISEVMMELYHLVDNLKMDICDQMILKEVINDLRRMLDFLRYHQSGEMSRLNYLLDDFTMMARLSANPTTQRGMAYARDWLSKIKKHMMESRFEERCSKKDVMQLIGSEILKEEQKQKQLTHVAMWAYVNLSNGKSMEHVLVDMIVRLMTQNLMIDRVPKNMSEAVILGVIRKLEHFPVKDSSIKTDHEIIMKEVINELRMMMDFLRANNSGIGSLNCLLADFGLMAQLSTNPITQSGMAYARDWLSKIEKCMMKSGFEEERSLEKDVLKFIGIEIIKKEEHQILKEEEHQLTNEVRWACLGLSRETSMEDVLVDMIVQLITQRLPINMSEAVIFGAIQKLECFPVENPSIHTRHEMILKEVVNKLRVMLDFLMDNKSEQGHRWSLNYLIADFAEMAQLSTDSTIKSGVSYARDWLRKIENCMIKSRVEEERRLDKDVLKLIGKEILEEEEQQLTREARQACLSLSSKTSMKEVLVDLIVQLIIESLHRNKSEGIIYEARQKLDNFMGETPSSDSHDEQIVIEVVNELSIILDFLRDKESGEKSRLNYLLADFAEMAQVSADHTAKYEIAEARDWMRKTKKRMMQFGVNERVGRSILNEGPSLKTSRTKCIDDFFFGYGVKKTPQRVGEGDEGVVVGLEKDVQQLIGRVILSENTSLVTSCIKGMLGVGKTTLARQVYNHPAIVENFMRRAWVYISSDTSIHEVLMELIHQLLELDVDSLLLEEMDNRSLQQMLHHHLQGWPYFIVLDNMLPEMRLESILIGLPQEGHGSRLLLTNRHKIKTPYLYYTHEMKALDSDKSWQLFLKTIHKFTRDEHKFPKHLEMKGKEMLKKCWGLPIAIIDVARQKAKQRLSGIEWEELLDSIDLGEILKLLEQMYHELDEKLKPWFLHMPFFKENAIIREGKLVQIRIASGSATEWRIEGNISDLVSQSIVEAVNRGGKYRLNPLLHMLSIKKAEEEIGFEILRNDGNNRPSQNARHRVIHCGREKFNHSTNQDSEHLISLIFHGGGAYLDDTSPSYWESFEPLKILDIEDFGVKTLSETIGTLMELRYLGLRNNYLIKIPHSFGDLEYLEVLDIALNFMVEVPDIIWKMRSLRHLYMSDVVSPEPLKIDVTDLHTLIYVSIYDWACEVARLETMTCLRKIGIEEIDDNSDVSKLFASLAKLRYLFHLFLRGFRFRSMSCLDKIGVLKKLRKIKLDGLLSRLPSADDFPQLVNDLILVNTCLDEDPMPVLEKLPQLWRLKLRNAYTGREMVIQSSGFPELEVLRINELWNVRKVQIGEGAMRDLKQLEIKNCPHLESLSEEIGSMKYLNKFEMVTSKHIATKIRNSSLLAKIVEVDIIP